MFALQTLICDVHAMTSDHHKWTQVKYCVQYQIYTKWFNILKTILLLTTPHISVSYRINLPYNLHTAAFSYVHTV